MKVTSGRVVVLRIYDIADEVDMGRAEALVRNLSRRPRFVRKARQISLPSPPLEMSLGPRPSPFAAIPSADVLVRIYDVGALAVSFSLPLPAPLDGEALIALAGRIEDAEDAFTAAGRTIADEIVQTIRSACKAGAVSEATEDYTIFRITGTEPRADADTLSDRLDIARLLLGETGAISKRERVQQSHSTISYSPEELVVIDWNSALIYDPSTSTDIADLLELSTMQLLELRAYDDLVGRSLTRVYEELGHERWLFKASKFSRLSRQIMRLFVDVTEMSDRIENSLHTLGDSWLARVHRAAVQEFEIPRWQRLLKDKLEVLRQINALLTDQITSRKALRLETAIVVLIIIEIIFAVFKLG